MKLEDNPHWEARNSDKNSLCFWYPKIDGKIPTPKTVIHEIDKSDRSAILSAMYENDDDSTLKSKIEIIVDGFIKSANVIGYPLFMRTDEFSGKHSFEDTCCVKTESDLIPQFWRLMEENSMVDFFGLPFRAIVFREFLDLEGKFKAFLGMPVGKERRYFVRNGKVECHHPYWPEESIHSWKYELPDNWKSLLEDINTETQEEIELLTQYAKNFGELVGPEYYSVDFAYSKEKGWVLIDAALGDCSYHDPGCPFCPKHMRREEGPKIDFKPLVRRNENDR